MSKRKKETQKVIPIHPCLVAYNDPENGLVVMLDNNEFDTPAIWGIVLADVVQHLVNAYVKDGMSAREVKTDITTMLLSELTTPTAKAHRVEPEWKDEGFMINRPEGADQDEDYFPEEDEA